MGAARDLWPGVLRPWESCGKGFSPRLQVQFNVDNGSGHTCIQYSTLHIVHVHVHVQGAPVSPRERQQPKLAITSGVRSTPVGTLGCLGYS